MQIIKIKESGSNSILTWAIKSEADIKNDMPLQSLINDELFYLVTLDDVNFFELFRLTQMYRNKIRVIDEKVASIPPRSELRMLFPGDFGPSEDKPDERAPLHELTEHVMTTFMNLVAQMENDDDIIRPGTLRMFLPMLTRKFSVQIPVSFMDFIESLSVQESEEIFTPDYPSTLNAIISAEGHSFKRIMQLGFIRATSIIKYNPRYDEYLKAVKYGFLRSYTEKTPFKFRMLGFHKYDPVSRGEVRFNMFSVDPTGVGETMKRLASIDSSPLQIQFVVQLPIQYMQILLSSCDAEQLGVAYESSMSSIIDTGMPLEDFLMPEIDEEADSEERANEIQMHNNSINSYRIRITEANVSTLNAIPILINSESDVDITSAFALLPAIYGTKAVLTLTLDDQHIKFYTNHYEPVLREMFTEMLSTAKNITDDINRAKNG